MTVQRICFGLLLATLVASLNVAAAPRFWTLTGVQLEDGAVATGYFSYDDVTGTIADWNVRVSGGAWPFIPWAFVPANSGPWPTGTFYVYSYLPGLSRDSTAWWRSFEINPFGRLDGSSTSVPIDVSMSREFFENDNFGVLDSRKIIAGSLALTTSPPPTPQVDINQHGLTGSWHIPGAAGQGIQIEVYQDAIAPGIGYLHGSFATHAAGAETGQRWYTFGGTVRTGETSSTLVIHQSTGGNFNAPPATLSMPIGTMLLTFVDCDIAVMEWDFRLGEPPFAGWGSLAGREPLLRLTPNIGCSLDGASRQDADFAYSGHWFDPANSGQGLFVELNPTAEAAFMVWYTYTGDGASRGAEGQRWYTVQGRFVPGARTLPLTLYETTGGVAFGWDDRFGFVPASTELVGTATATFLDCHATRLAFAFTQGSNAGASGSINLSRVGPASRGCDR